MAAKKPSESKMFLSCIKDSGPAGISRN